MSAQPQPPIKIYRCKHCHVQVMGKSDFRPIFTKQHKKSCPRARNLN